MKKKISVVLSVLFCISILFSSVTAFAGEFVTNANQTYVDRVEELGFPLSNPSQFLISADSDGNLYYFWLRYPGPAFYNYTYNNQEYVIFYNGGVCSCYTATLTTDWVSSPGGDVPLYVAFGPSAPADSNDFWQTALDNQVIPSNRSYCFAYGGNQLVYDGGSLRVPDLMEQYFDDHPWWISDTELIFNALSELGNFILNSFTTLFASIVDEPVLLAIVLVAFGVTLLSFVYSIYYLIITRKSKKVRKRGRKRG